MELKVGKNSAISLICLIICSPLRIIWKCETGDVRWLKISRIISTGILRVGECMSESELEADGCVSHATFIFCLLNLIDTRTFSAPVCTHVYT